MFLQIVFWTFLLNVISSPANADITLLEKNSPAPYTGILFPIDEAQKLRKDLLELDYNKALNESYKKSLDYQESIIEKKNNQLDLLYKQNDKLIETNLSQKKWTELERWVFFGLGLLTMYGASNLK